MDARSTNLAHMIAINYPKNIRKKLQNN